MSALIVIWILCAIAGAAVADKRGRNPAGWAVICILTGLIGLLILLVIPRRGNTRTGVQADDARVPCPACAELILPSAKLCKHCGTSLSPMAVAPGPPGEAGTP